MHVGHAKGHANTNFIFFELPVHAIWSFFYCNMANYYKCRHLLFCGYVDLGSHDQNECVGLAESSAGVFF